ncbi:MAG: ABC transporter substrate-binding protein [Candidatus Bipolaricaulis sp.]|nr:ABC transporter substrate-binding protein [Candidatus Bipolaricaulis sp.]
MRVVRLTLGVLFAVSTAVLLCAVPSFGAEPGEITVAQSGFGAHLDPHRGYGDNAHVLQSIYDGLTRLDAEGNLLPGLAESWEQLTPGTMRFHLRQGVTFHNGDELTAEVVKLNVDRMMSPSEPRQAYSFKFTGCTVVDKYTVDITASPADPLFANKISYMGIAAATLCGYPKSDQFAKTPIGTGPFKFVEWVADQRIVLVANDAYWRGAPEVRKITYRVIPELSTQISELATGGVDIVMGIPSEFVPQVQASGIVRVVPMMSTVNRVVVFRCDQPDSPLAKREVRQAINHAVNVDLIIEQILGGYAHREATVCHPTDFGFNPNVAPYSYDPNKAKELLAAAGYPNGFTVDFDYNPTSGTSGPKLTDVAQTIVADLAQVGIKANLVAYDQAAMSSRVYKARNVSPVFDFGWKTWYNDPGDTFYGLFHSQSIYAYTNNAEIDSLIIAGRAEMDRDKAREIYGKIQELLFVEAPALFLWYVDDLYAISNRINWTPRVDGRIYLYDATFY